MSNYLKIGINIILAAGALSGEPHTYTGAIVNAK